MNETYKKLILLGASVLIVLGAWFLGIKPIRENTKSIQSEVKNLTNHYNDLLSKEVNREQYKKDTEANRAMFDEKLGEFPSNLNQEYQLTFVQGIRNNPDIDYNVIAQGMQPEAAFYALGGSNSEGVVATEGDATATEGDAAATEGDAAATQEAASEGYQCYSSTMTFNYTGSYSGVKGFVNYVAAYPYRMTIDSVSVSKSEDAEDLYTGSMSVNIFCIKGNGREENMDVDYLDDIETGSDNLFTGGSAAGIVSKFAEDNGESIKSDYDLYAAVNPTSSDTSGKIVGLRSGGTNVTSDKNETEAITVTVSKEGENYVVQYGIGAEKQSQEFDPGEDLTMLIQSSELKDDSDSNAITLSLENTTDKTLYVKVVDDATANRVKITNRAGSVIVYK